MPLNIDLDLVEDIGGKLQALNSSKIYCDTRKFATGDFLVFEESVIHGARFEIIGMGIDFLGSHLIVSGYVPNHASRFTKSHTQNVMESVIEFQHQTSMAYYDITNTDHSHHQLWLTTYPDVIPGGRAGSVMSYVEIYYDKSATDLNEVNNLTSSDFVYGIKSEKEESTSSTEMQKIDTIKTYCSKSYRRF